jgi:YVTN family beta-propeller protein
MSGLCLSAALLAGCGPDGVGPDAVDQGPGLAPLAARDAVHPQGIVDRVEVVTPWGVAVRDDGLTYFSQLALGGVARTSTRTRALDGFVATGLAPTGIVLSPDGAALYVANQFANTVSVVDVASNSVVADIAVESPLSLAVSPDGRRLYASSFLSPLVAEIDLVTEVVTRTFALGGSPQELALNRRGTRLYVANESGYLDEIDLVSGQVTGHIPLPGGAFGIGVTPDDAQAYVTLPQQGLIQVFRLQPARLARTIPVGGEPRRVAFSQRGSLAAVTNAAGFLTFVR